MPPEVVAHVVKLADGTYSAGRLDGSAEAPGRTPAEALANLLAGDPARGYPSVPAVEVLPFGGRHVARFVGPNAPDLMAAGPTPQTAADKLALLNRLVRLGCAADRPDRAKG